MSTGTMTGSRTRSYVERLHDLAERWWSKPSESEDLGRPTGRHSVEGLRFREKSGTTVAQLVARSEAERLGRFSWPSGINVGVSSPRGRRPRPYPLGHGASAGELRPAPYRRSTLASSPARTRSQPGR
jgi:hypothetical protein